MNKNVKTALIIGSASATAISTLDDYTDRYDDWYNSPKGRALLTTEVACLQPLVERLPKPYLEVGVGTGRFAEALGIEWGIDPWPSALEKARRRCMQPEDPSFPCYPVLRSLSMLPSRPQRVGEARPSCGLARSPCARPRSRACP